MASKEPGKGGPVRNPKPKKMDEEDLEDLEMLMEQTDKPKCKTVSYTRLSMGQWVTKGEDRQVRLEGRTKRAEEAAAKAQPDDDEDDEKETEKDRLERETRELVDQLKKAERQEALSRDKEEKEQAKQFSKRIQGGTFLKQMKAVMLVATHKRKKTLKTENIKSADEEDEQDTIPEGFHLQVESPHCLNMEHAEDYQAYLRQVVLEFEQLLKAGGTDMKDAYGKIIRSMYWACQANKQTIVNGADLEEVIRSIPDPKCHAWKLKLSGKDSVDPSSLVEDLPIGPQTASKIVSMKPQEVMEVVEEELAEKHHNRLTQLRQLLLTYANPRPWHTDMRLMQRTTSLH